MGGSAEGDVLKAQWYGRRQRTEGQRGAVLVEAGLVIPLLLFIVFGIIEYGGVLATKSSAANAVRSGGRMASVQGNNLLADQATLVRIEQDSQAVDDGEIEYIIIWHAAGPEDEVPAGCLTIADGLGTANATSQGVAGSCNIYAHPQAAGGAFDMASGEVAPGPEQFFGCTDASQSGSKLDCNWRAGTRDTQISPRGTTPRELPDYVGVYILIEHNYLTGLLGDSSARRTPLAFG